MWKTWAESVNSSVDNQPQMSPRTIAIHSQLDRPPLQFKLTSISLSWRSNRMVCVGSQDAMKYGFLARLKYARGKNPQFIYRHPSLANFRGLFLDVMFR